MSATNRGGDRDELDRYYTPRSLARRLTARLPLEPGDVVMEPSCGGGAFIRAAKGMGVEDIHATDLDPDAEGLSMVPPDHAKVCDYTERTEEVDWTIGNPPFNSALAHVRHALKHSRKGVAFLLRLSFLETKERHPFWKMHPPESVSVMSKRPSFTDGGTDSAAYAWFVWRTDEKPERSELHVLPPFYS